jgi:hypothetical protein
LLRGSARKAEPGYAFLSHDFVRLDKTALRGAAAAEPGADGRAGFMKALSNFGGDNSPRLSGGLNTYSNLHLGKSAVRLYEYGVGAYGAPRRSESASNGSASRDL